MNKGHYSNCFDPTDCWCEVRRLSKVLWITFGILLLEIIGGVISNSLALYADAGHVFGDSTAIIVTLIAAVLIKFGSHTQNVRNTAFWINIGLLFLIAGWVMFEAIERFQKPHEIMGPVLVGAAFLGGLGNWWQHAVLEGAADEHKHHAHHALSFHIISDLMQSIVVVIGGIVIWVSGWFVIDPILSVGIACWIIYRAVQLSLGQSEG